MKAMARFTATSVAAGVISAVTLYLSDIRSGVCRIMKSWTYDSKKP